MKKPSIGKGLANVLAFGVSALLFAGFGAVFVVTAPFHVLFGWIGYATRVLPAITVGPSALVTSLVTFVALVITAQLFAARVRPGWPLRWTLTGIGAVVAMFAASIAGAGVLHQLGWMITTREPLIASSWTRPQMEHQRACSLLGLRSLPPGPKSAAALRAQVFAARLTEPNERFAIHVDEARGTDRYRVLLVPRDAVLRAESGARLCGRDLDERVPSERIDEVLRDLRTGTSSTATTTATVTSPAAE
ncbi:hypothetical protein L6R52_34385 [Myxococcota bacterium]|nr:hypothetical protein [Myxococcota bacterium]